MYPTHQQVLERPFMSCGELTTGGYPELHPETKEK
jgi:hypothetical protein